MANDLIRGNITLRQCFFCSSWTPPLYLHKLTLEGVEQEVCSACYRKLVARLQQLELEEAKIIEDQQFEDDYEETKAAFKSLKSKKT